MPSRWAAKSTWSSTTIGPDARNSVALTGVEAFIAFGVVVAASAVATVTPGAVGELLQAIHAAINNAIGTNLRNAFMELCPFSSPSEPVPNLAPNPHPWFAKHHHASRTPTRGNLAASLHPRAQRAVRVGNTHASKKHMLVVLHNTLRTDHRDLPVEGELGEAIQLQARLFSRTQSRDIGLGHCHMHHG